VTTSARPNVDREFLRRLAVSTAVASSERTAVPTLRPATVVDSTEGVASVILDGDDSPVLAEVLVPEPLPDDRVMVLLQPPSGAFVVGYVGASRDRWGSGGGGGGGGSWKAAARLATSGNVTLSGTAAIDGTTPVAGDRVLVKGQTTAADNGIYVVASGTWTRATDAASGADLLGATVVVTEGTLYRDTTWVCTTNAPITVGTTAITWAPLGAPEVNVSTGGPTTRIGELLWVDTDATLPAPVSTGWQLLTLTPPWVNYGGWAPASIRRIGDVVELRGLVQPNGAGASTTIADVPAPTAGSLIFLGAADMTGGGQSFCRMDVGTNGKLVNGAAVLSYLSLSQIRYSVA
jgi:hypothetical protein